MQKNIIIITGTHTDEKTLQSIVEHLDAHYGLQAEISDYNKPFETDSGTLCLLYLGDDEIKWFFKQHMNAGSVMGIIPHKACRKAMSSFGIAKDLFEAIDDALKEQASGHIDVLVCNGEPVFNNIIIGDVHGLNQSAYPSQGIVGRIRSFISNLAQLSFRDYTFTTAKGQNIQTAATGVMVLEHSTHGVSQNLINEDLSMHDGKLNTLILAPTSILSYLYYLLMAFFYHRFSINNLPKSVGLIITSKLDITSSTPMDYLVDGVSISAKEISLEVLCDALNIRLGRHITDLPNKKNGTEEEKDTIRVHGLPKGEMKQLLISEPVPLFKKAAEEDFKELFLSLKQNAALSISFLVLMVLSTMLATTGLFQNSAPVIIGAMILAPLMAPIVSLSMGVVRGEAFLIKESSRTIFIGVATALAFSCLYAYVMPLNTLTDEMHGRLNPNLLDLMVAIISGIAGAYAHSKTEIAKSLAGVAIAVALVPPLSVTGIGLGWGDTELIYGSFLLFITNLAGITLAAAMTFVVLGYAPIHRAKKGIVITTGFLLMITIPLIFSFMMVIKQNRALEHLESVQHMTLGNQQVMLRILSVDLSKEKPLISIEIHSNELLMQHELRAIKAKIESVLERPVVLSVTPKIMMD